MLNIPAGWKPISSAPKDGTDILLTNGVHVSCGHWHYDEGGTTEHRDLDGRYIGQDDRDGFAGWLDWMGGMTPNPTHWMPLPAAPGSVSPSAPGDAQDEPIGTLSRNADETIRFTPARDFHVKDGMPVFSTPAAGDALDAARWRFVRRKLCLTGNGDGTCTMAAINLPASIPGWPEPGSAVADFCDAAIDAAIAAQRKGDA